MRASMLTRWRLWWSQEQGSLHRVALWMAVASVISRFLGVLRDHLLAAQYGAGWELDAYYAAFRLPDTIYNLLIIGALSAGFIPLYAELKAKHDEKHALQFSSFVFGWLALSLFVLSACGVVFAPYIVPQIVHGFDPERMALTVALTRILFLSPFFLGISAVFGGVLQASRRMMAFAFAPVWYNIGILIGILGFARWFGIAGVAMGVVCGAMLHAVTQGVVAFGLGVAWPRPLRWMPEISRLLKLTAPRLAALGAAQISLVISLSFASTLRAGSVSVFQLGNNLQSFPLGVIGVSFAVAAFPLLSEAAGSQRFDRYHEALAKTGRTIVFFLLPVSLLFLLLRAQLVRLVLGDGRFDWAATIETASVVGWFSLSLVAQALIPLLARAFYAIQSTWTPFWITFFGEILNIALAWSLKDRFGVAGLAMAFSLTTFVQLCCLWMGLRRRVGHESQAAFLRLLAVSFGACIPAVIVGYGLRQLVGTVFPLETFFQVALQFGGASLGMGVTYLAILWFLRVEEAQTFLTRGWETVRRVL